MIIPSPAVEKGQRVPMILNIGRDGLLQLLEIYYKSKGLPSPVPQDAEVSVRVPDGGDYSGMDLEIDQHHGDSTVINIRWRA